MNQPKLVRYDAMCRAIDAAYKVDEVKDIHDKAVALEIYARQAHNTEAEMQACEIRLRAERKAGVEPDRQISRIRLSDKTSRPTVAGAREVEGRTSQNYRHGTGSFNESAPAPQRWNFRRSGTQVGKARCRSRRSVRETARG